MMYQELKEVNRLLFEGAWSNKNSDAPVIKLLFHGQTWYMYVTTS